nr:MAG: hypothetical protein [flactilig virus 10]
MFKSFSSFFHLRILTLLLLLLSADVHLNPGPFYNFSFRIATINTIPSQSITQIPTGPIEGLLTITSTGAAIELQTPFGTCFTTAHTSDPISTILLPFNFTNTQSTWTFTKLSSSANGALNVNLSLSTSIPPVSVSIVSPAVLPVQIDNTDPIEVTIPTTAPIPITGQVSIANPIPSVASTILNALKK